MNILYYSAFKAIGRTRDELTPSDISLVWAGSVRSEVEFTVVDSPNPYNAILGRGWLHGMKAIALTLHQCIRFIGTSKRQETIRGN